MVKHTTVVYVMIVVAKNKRKNPTNQVGKKQDIRKKPHAIYVALKVC
jgi:hypothetical protein